VAVLVLWQVVAEPIVSDSHGFLRRSFNSLDRTNNLGVASDRQPNRNDYDLSVGWPIENTEGKPLKNELACAVICKREGVWSVPNSG
jgi:hypothetical protein